MTLQVTTGRAFDLLYLSIVLSPYMFIYHTITWWKHQDTLPHISSVSQRLSSGDVCVLSVTGVTKSYQKGKNRDLGFGCKTESFVSLRVIITTVEWLVNEDYSAGIATYGMHFLAWWWRQSASTLQDVFYNWSSSAKTNFSLVLSVCNDP